jgi:hypothetical protein
MVIGVTEILGSVNRPRLKTHYTCISEAQGFTLALSKGPITEGSLLSQFLPNKLAALNLRGLLGF